MGKILIISTSADKAKDGSPTGLWLEELAAPYYLFKDAGYQIDIATPMGGKTPIDDVSLQGDALTETASKFHQSDSDMEALNAAKKVSEIKDTSVYDAIYIPGGHGAAIDLPFDKDVQRLIAEFSEKDKVVGSVCHGPASIAYVKLSDGNFLVKDKTVTGFSNSEEKAVGREDAVVFSLEDALTQAGAKYVKQADWSEHVVVCKKLVTGQNPQSSKAVGEAILKLLEP